MSLEDLCRREVSRIARYDYGYRQVIVGEPIPSGMVRGRYVRYRVPVTVIGRMGARYDETVYECVVDEYSGRVIRIRKTG